MKMEMEIDDDSFDRAMVARLRLTLKSVRNPAYANMYPDAPELISALRTVIDLYKVPSGPKE